MFKSLHSLAHRLWHEHTVSPWRLAAAVSLGVVIGCTPFFGLHLWIGLALGFFLQLNRLAIILGSQISIPPIAPILGLISVQVGSMVMTGHLLHLTLADFTLSRIPNVLFSFFSAWIIGGLMVGFAVAIPVFFITAFLVQWRRGHGLLDEGSPGKQQQPELSESATSWQETSRQMVRRFSSAPRHLRYYVKCKLHWDPVYRQIANLLHGRQNILDLGTGLGLFPILSAIRGRAGNSIGIDWDSSKIKYGQQASMDLPQVKLIQADLRAYEYPPSDAVLLIDVLHYYDARLQEVILSRAVNCLQPGGLILLRETEPSQLSFITRGLEWMALRSGWNRGPALHYQPIEDICTHLEELGLQVSIKPSCSYCHRGNILLIATPSPMVLA
jgi:uncharacterized protein (DUF2062 family)/ubiquinone/menaquinone biosynthesis C-methylase UbiE